MRRASGGGGKDQRRAHEREALTRLLVAHVSNADCRLDAREPRNAVPASIHSSRPQPITVSGERLTRNVPAMPPCSSIGSHPLRLLVRVGTLARARFPPCACAPACTHPLPAPLRAHEPSRRTAALAGVAADLLAPMEPAGRREECPVPAFPCIPTAAFQPFFQARSESTPSIPPATSRPPVRSS